MSGGGLAGQWLLAGGVSNPHPYDGPLPWGIFAAIPLLLVGIPLAIGGVVMAVAAARTHKKASDHLPGLLLLLLGVGATALGVRLF